ncbi:Uu.00g013470.m01.CDS01 [Anthostomella pinea]|uniref:Uu.00g013470.m01.CDS01 n=1 Tax=Anthostomella pinea TaxID=933095 RepID=A0AAI8VZD7_9PEZI|nr:Uu.00g013470.m01.CDS01 [Anthostomella pinea]
MATTTNKSPTFRVIQGLTHDEKLLQSGRYSDVDVKCGTMTWKAHRFILSSRCAWFDKALNGRFKEAAIGVVVIENFESTQIDALIKYLYSGEYDKWEFLKPLSLTDKAELAESFSREYFEAVMMVYRRESLLLVKPICDLLVSSFAKVELYMLSSQTNGIRRLGDVPQFAVDVLLSNRGGMGIDFSELELPQDCKHCGFNPFSNIFGGCFEKVRLVKVDGTSTFKLGAYCLTCAAKVK